MERGAFARCLAALAMTLATLTACSGGGSSGTNVVLGDSNSTPRGDDWDAWPELLFGDDYVNKAGGGVSTHRVVAACTGTPCWWIDRSSEEDVWWIMLGTNDLFVDPESTADRYAENLRTIVEAIPARDIRLISSPRVHASPHDARNVHLDEQALVDARLCETDPRVTCMGDLGRVLSFDAHYMDPVHLNPEGHRAVARFLAER